VQVAISTEDEPPTSAPAADAPTATPAPPTAVPSAPTPAPPTATPEPPTAVPVTNDPSRYGELDADGQVTVASFPLPDDAAGVQAVFSGGVVWLCIQQHAHQKKLPIIIGKRWHRMAARKSPC
ncbi:MAG: hypothetical protein HC893_08865, partial [Chloroflexaceae bacterium]|nr:hypothetical protein [Chloroflexaceae bacterium]